MKITTAHQKLQLLLQSGGVDHEIVKIESAISGNIRNIKEIKSDVVKINEILNVPAEIRTEQQKTDMADSADHALLLLNVLLGE